MTDLPNAIRDYLTLERVAMKKPEGADHRAIMADVAERYGVDFDTLSEAVIDFTIKGAC